MVLEWVYYLHMIKDLVIVMDEHDSSTPNEDCWHNMIHLLQTKIADTTNARSVTKALFPVFQVVPGDEANGAWLGEDITIL